MLLNIDKDLSEQFFNKTAAAEDAKLELLSAPGAAVEVWLVDANMVRNTFSSDFVGGGHHGFYPFIPENQVWIADDVHEDERPIFLLHELHERYKMHLGLEYDEAHESAKRLEDECRSNPELLIQKLQEAWKQNLEIA